MTNNYFNEKVEISNKNLKTATTYSGIYFYN